MNNIVQRIQDCPRSRSRYPIVDDDGKYVGWATFVVTGAVPDGRNGTINGHFETGIKNAQLNVVGAGFGSSTYGGQWYLGLVN